MKLRKHRIKKVTQVGNHVKHSVLSDYIDFMLYTPLYTNTKESAFEVLVKCRYLENLYKNTRYADLFKREE